jgi:hemerythrin-like domain-containing protein
MTDDLDLAARDGLPDALRVLQKDYPRGSWDAHRNFDGLVAFWMERHLMFRKLCMTLREDAEATEAHRLAPAQRDARLVRFGSMLLQQLHGHHQIEDQHYFPILVKHDARLARGFDILDRDHHAMDGLLERFGTAANGVLQGKVETAVFRDEVAEFEALLLRHLEDEEDLIVPILLKHGSRGLG